MENYERSQSHLNKALYTYILDVSSIHSVPEADKLLLPTQSILK